METSVHDSADDPQFRLHKGQLGVQWSKWVQPFPRAGSALQRHTMLGRTRA